MKRNKALWPKIFALCFALLLCCACVKKQNIELPRPQASYTRWLEKEAMLTQAPEFIAEVSQTDLMWLNGSKGSRAEILLEAAPIWFETNAYAPNAKTPVLRDLSTHIPELAQYGFKGIYLGPTSENLEIWLKPGQAPQNSGKTAASLTFGANMGDERDFTNFTQKAEESGLQIGADIIPAATGQGPDFILQARNAPAHTGVYAMLPCPKEYWHLLPEISEEWGVKQLSNETVAALAAQGVLPQALKRDSMDWTAKGGWAVTDVIMGSDGKERRWLYRFDGDVRAPVLFWQDPSGNAKKIFSAAIIRQTGLQRQALAGLRMQALFGLEPADNSGDASSSYAPGSMAINELVEQIHRYGGMALQADAIPADAISAIISGDCDFSRDAVTPAYLAVSLLQKDPGPVTALYKSWLAANLDQTRLARGLNDWQGIDLQLSGQQPNLTNNVVTVGKLTEILNSRHKTSVPEQQISNFLLNWRIGLPGLVFINAEDLNENLKQLLKTRNAAGLATGKIVKAIRGKKPVAAILTELPTGGYWLITGNFDSQPQSMLIEIPRSVNSALDAATAENLTDNLQNGQTFTIELDGLQSKNIIFNP